MRAASMLGPVVEHLGRLYPLKSGCGRLANSAFCRWIDSASHADCVARVTGGKAVVPSGDHVGRAMRFFGDLDPKLSWVVDAALCRGDVALDIGSNLGLVSLRMAARVGPSGQVHSFDPQPRMQSYFRRTLALNPTLPIRFHPYGLGAENATLTLRVPEGNAGAASLQHRNPGGSAIDVPIRTLDDVAGTEGIERVDLIKIDVEGFEHQVLQGGIRVIARTRPKIIVVEDNTGFHSPALRMLQDMEYDLFCLPQLLWSVRLRPLTPGANVGHDFVAVAREAPTEVRQRLKLPH